MGTRAWVWACALMGACAQVEEQCERCGDSESSEATGSTASGAGAASESSAADETLGVPEDTDAEGSTGIVDTTTSTSAGPTCRELDEPCAHDGECCIHPDGALVCVANDDGASCQRSCDADDDCASGCCSPLHGGGGACAPSEACAHDCAPLDAACETDDDCCDGTSCADRLCVLACDDDDACPSGSCGETSCAASQGCDDGSHFCSDGTTMFECDHDAWYTLDCAAACIEAGWNGSSGCAYADIYDDATCLCTDAADD